LSAVTLGYLEVLESLKTSVFFITLNNEEKISWQNLTYQLKQEVSEFFRSIGSQCKHKLHRQHKFVFLSGVDEDFNVTEEFGGMQSTNGWTTGKDMQGNSCFQLSCDFNKFVGICTYTTPICGKNDAVVLLQE